MIVVFLHVETVDLFMYPDQQGNYFPSAALEDKARIMSRVGYGITALGP